MSLGNNGAIISNSKHYKILLPYGVTMAFSVYYLNLWMIELIGINGAALSTLIVIVIFNILRIWYVKNKFNILPFNNKTLKLILILIGVFIIFYFWNFSFHSVINIILKTILITVVYIFLIKKFQISKEINELINRYFKGSSL
jgi:O-antigen/teichoic acid export membrane protein